MIFQHSAFYLQIELSSLYESFFRLGSRTKFQIRILHNEDTALFTLTIFQQYNGQ
jgi:hypothetical protein